MKQQTPVRQSNRIAQSLVISGQLDVGVEQVTESKATYAVVAPACLLTVVLLRFLHQGQSIYVSSVSRASRGVTSFWANLGGFR